MKHSSLAAFLKSKNVNHFAKWATKRIKSFVCLVEHTPQSSKLLSSILKFEKNYTDFLCISGITKNISSFFKLTYFCLLKKRQVSITIQLIINKERALNVLVSLPASKVVAN